MHSPRPYLTEAQKRTLRKAVEYGCVMIYGRFSGEGETGFDVEMPEFDRAMHIEDLINRKLLRVGKHFNQYVATDAGRGLVSRRRATA